MEFKKFLCFIGLHNWKCTTRRRTSTYKISFPWFIIYYKCVNCPKKKRTVR